MYLFLCFQAVQSDAAADTFQLNFLSLDALAPDTAGYGTQFRFLQCMAAHFNGAADRIHRQRYARRQLHGQIFAVGRKSPYISRSAETDVQHSVLQKPLQLLFFGKRARLVDRKGVLLTLLQGDGTGYPVHLYLFYLICRIGEGTCVIMVCLLIRSGMHAVLVPKAAAAKKRQTHQGQCRQKQNMLFHFSLPHILSKDQWLRTMVNSNSPRACCPITEIT